MIARHGVSYGAKSLLGASVETIRQGLKCKAFSTALYGPVHDLVFWLNDVLRETEHYATLIAFKC